MLVHKDLSPGAALVSAFDDAWTLSATQGKLLWRMLLGQVSVKNLNGPLSIAQYAGESAQAGPETFISFLVLISLALALFNLLPTRCWMAGRSCSRPQNGSKASL